MGDLVKANMKLNNTTASTVATDLHLTKKSHHMAHGFHHVNEQIFGGVVQVEWINTTPQFEEILTKLLGTSFLDCFRGSAATLTKPDKNPSRGRQTLKILCIRLAKRSKFSRPSNFWLNQQSVACGKWPASKSHNVCLDGFTNVHSGDAKTSVEHSVHIYQCLLLHARKQLGQSICCRKYWVLPSTIWLWV